MLPIPVNSYFSECRMVVYCFQKEGIMMKKNSLTTLIILIIFVLVALRFFWFLPAVAIFLFISVFRLVRNILNQNQNQNQDQDQKEEDAGQTVDAEAEPSQHREKADTIITCDYCGSKVDTSKYAVCNHCGGPYGDDDEWKKTRNRKVG
jgi:ribosomal protein L37E